jgi:hypothetical protein
LADIDQRETRGVQTMADLPLTAMTSALETTHQLTLDPLQAFGPVPFWFWNDDLSQEELIRQLRAFHEAGCGGVIPHARVGLSRRIGYLTDTFLGLVRAVVEEASRLGMTVILYDEGSYPSGSASGAVVAEDADFASQAIGLWEQEVLGPAKGFWRPNTGRALRDRHVCTVAARCVGDGSSVDPLSLLTLTPLPHDVIPYDLPEGRWRLLSVWNTDSGGQIRGAFADEESGSATAPAAGDILNPDAVACFIRLTHERYRHFVGDHFGSTITAMFTDEPSVFGKSPRRPAKPEPFTSGFVEWLTQLWGEDPRPWLPALWVDYGPLSKTFRQRYHRAVQTRLHEVFYAAQNHWCAANGLALTGHPGASNDMASLAAFHIPGQDMVWRYVTPGSTTDGSTTALEGPHSVAPKAATSGARRSGARRILSELCGAYGWRLSLDEVKWLFDWHMVRGNNLLNPHAFFYSIEGRRAWESEPDLGLHSAWWPQIGHLLKYAGRVSAVLADAENVCAVAILGDAQQLPWRAASVLLRGQRDFIYLDAEDILRGRVCDARLHVGGAGYCAVVVDGDPGLVAGDLDQRLEELVEAGVTVVRSWEEDDSLTAQLGSVPPTVEVIPTHEDLRVSHLRRAGLDLFYLVNEGEHEIAGALRLPAAGAVEAWDLLRGTRRSIASFLINGATEVQLQLPRRESLMLAVDPQGAPVAVTSVQTGISESIDIPASAWTIRTPAGNPCEGVTFGDWSRQAGWELFSGTLVYHAALELPALGGLLDLGEVGEIAEYRLDGEVIGVSLWAPHQLQLPAGRGGMHQIEIHVTNSMANEYDGAQLPAGLIGPVRFHAIHTSGKDQQ